MIVRLATVRSRSACASADQYGTTRNRIGLPPIATMIGWSSEGAGSSTVAVRCSGDTSHEWNWGGWRFASGYACGCPYRQRLSLSGIVPGFGEAAGSSLGSGLAGKSQREVAWLLLGLLAPRVSHRRGRSAEGRGRRQGTAVSTAAPSNPNQKWHHRCGRSYPDSGAVTGPATARRWPLFTPSPRSRDRF